MGSLSPELSWMGQVYLPWANRSVVKTKLLCKARDFLIAGVPTVTNSVIKEVIGL